MTISETLYNDIRTHLLKGENEEVALLFAYEAHLSNMTALIVRRWEPVPQQMLLHQAEDVFAVDSGFIVSRVKEARRRGESVLLAHSHPGDPTIPCFSRADAKGEEDFYNLLHLRLPGRLHGALVISPGGNAARFCLADGTRVNVDELRIIGRRIQRFFASSYHQEIISDETRARQQLIWGTHGQAQIRDATIGIVGAGGTGSVVAQQFIHLGAGRLIVIDPQPVEKSNLSRIVGAQRNDIGITPKVDVVKRLAESIDPDIIVEAIQGDVTQPDVLVALKEADIIFLCTDQHYSRMVVNALAVQYLIPLIDLGFLIEVEPTSHRLIAAVGEVRLVVPNGYCLLCIGVLDADRIRAEKASPEERAAFPSYFVGIDVPDPSVITLNSTIASLAVTAGCDMLVPTMRPVDPLDNYRYNAIKGLVANVRKEHHPACGICGIEGRIALADNLPLPQ